MDEREMFDEINALIGAVAKAMEVSEAEVITAIEQGRLGLEMMTDEQGRNYLEATCDGKSAHIYQGAIFRPATQPKPDEADTKDSHGDGCSCGH